MRPLLDMDTIQIEITNACVTSCSNCTRLCGHHESPYFMEEKDWKAAIDSMAQYPRMTGIMGGEPLLHPEFEAICHYLKKKVGKARSGLWTTLPKGFEHYREVIVDTFGHIFINDHTRDDIMHSPVLVAADEVELEPWRKDYNIHHCWVQNSWSASINPSGAWFCEIAAALALLLDKGDLAWPVQDGWWLRSPMHFQSQMEMCKYCGCAQPLGKRTSTEVVDDISPKMLELLKNKSRKIKKGDYVVHDCLPKADDREVATYKDENYRDKIAARYGMFLMVNEYKFQTPFLLKNWRKKDD